MNNKMANFCYYLLFSEIDIIINGKPLVVIEPTEVTTLTEYVKTIGNEITSKLN